MKCDEGKIPNGKIEYEAILNDTNRFRDWVLSPIIFPCVIEIMKMLHEINQTESKNCSFEFDQPIVCIWDEGTGSNMIKQWFIGFYLDENQDSQNKLYCIDHWERMEGSRNYLFWTIHIS